MDREVAQDLYALYERASCALTAAVTIIQRSPESEEREQHFQTLTDILADIFVNLRAPIIRQYPELNTDIPSGQPDTLLEPQYLEAVSRLTASEIERIDQDLLVRCSDSWRKVAYIVGTSMLSLREQLSGIPYSYYAQRVVVLVRNGKLESQGNLDYIRFSEIRLPRLLP